MDWISELISEYLAGLTLSSASRGIWMNSLSVDARAGSPTIKAGRGTSKS